MTRFRGKYYTAWAYMMAGATMTLVPILVVFLFTQQYFVRGVVLSGLKGCAAPSFGEVFFAEAQR